jgi:diguanylate cyclase (GGDEF)-like protein
LTSAAERHKKAMSVLIIDIDHFKRINDSHGHAIGDEVLRELGWRMANVVRAEDVLGRWGGEEFLVLLPQTAEEGAASVAERIRAAASASPVTLAGGASVRATVSIGGATTTRRFDETLVDRADEALYRAKEQGRDRVIVNASDPAVAVAITSRGGAAPESPKGGSEASAETALRKQ